MQSMLDSLNDPQTRHAAMVHAPIALGMVGVAFAFVAAVMTERRHVFRWIVVVVYLAMAGAARLALTSGEEAEGRIGIQPEAVQTLVEDHEDVAKWVWIFGLIVAGVFALSAISKPLFRTGAAWLGFLLSGGLAFWVAYTGHLGGTLVYEHGVGIAERPVVTPPSTEAVERDARLAHFVDTVRPVLVENCMGCHNPTRQRRSGNLDQTSIAGLLEGGWDGPAVVPGRPDDSTIIARITSELEDERMPPDGDSLPPETVEAIRRWIADGAVWTDRGLVLPDADTGTGTDTDEGTGTGTDEGTDTDAGTGTGS